MSRSSCSPSSLSCPGQFRRLVLGDVSAPDSPSFLRQSFSASSSSEDALPVAVGSGGNASESRGGGRCHVTRINMFTRECGLRRKIELWHSGRISRRVVVQLRSSEAASRLVRPICRRRPRER